jgi:hypothetical protein
MCIMTLLESGPAKFDRNYWIVVSIVFLAVAGYFVYDGAYGYAARNRARAEELLVRWTNLPEGRDERAKALDRLLGPSPTEDDFKRLQASKPATREQIHKALGNPLPPKPGQTAPEPVERFVSLYGLATVPIDVQGRVDTANMVWQKWAHTRQEVTAQFFWAILPAAGCVYFLRRVYTAAKLRAVIDEEGLTYGAVRIPFAEMLSLRDYSPKGWVDLYYRAGDVEKRLRIDNQKIAKFNEIIEMLCRKKGFENPLVAAAAEKEKEVADESPGESGS